MEAQVVGGAAIRPDIFEEPLSLHSQHYPHPLAQRGGGGGFRGGGGGGPQSFSSAMSPFPFIAIPLSPKDITHSRREINQLQKWLDNKEI